MSGAPGTILITDDSEPVRRCLESALKSLDHCIEYAETGEACLDKVLENPPQLIFLDLMLPKMHGIDVLKRLKGCERTRDIGVVVLTGKALYPDYCMAVQNGADYFLAKPFDSQRIRDIVHEFYSGTLKLAPFHGVTEQSDTVDYYEPPPAEKTTYGKFWGTRGSVSVSGADFLRYGGNTVSLELRDAQEESVIIIDAGTGIRAMGDDILKSGVKDIHLFIGHSHWDHVMGFPFFTPLYQKDCRIHIYAAKGFDKGVEELFTNLFDHEFFPVRLDEVAADVSFHDVSICDETEIGDYKLSFCYANHPGTTLCFKVEAKGKKVGYCTDDEFLLGYHGDPKKIDRDHPLLLPYREIINFYSDCDVLVHEAQYTPADYRNRVGWGHSSVSNAAVLLKHTGVKEWIVTHHDPSHTDQYLLEKLDLHRRVLADMDMDIRVHMAYDGYVLPF